MCDLRASATEHAIEKRAREVRSLCAADAEVAVLLSPKRWSKDAATAAGAAAHAACNQGHVLAPVATRDHNAPRPACASFHDVANAAAAALVNGKFMYGLSIGSSSAVDRRVAFGRPSGLVQIVGMPVKLTMTGAFEGVVWTPPTKVQRHDTRTYTLERGLVHKRVHRKQALSMLCRPVQAAYWQCATCRYGLFLNVMPGCSSELPLGAGLTHWHAPPACMAVQPSAWGRAGRHSQPVTAICSAMRCSARGCTRYHSPLPHLQNWSTWSTSCIPDRNSPYWQRARRVRLGQGGGVNAATSLLRSKTGGRGRVAHAEACRGNAPDRTPRTDVESAPLATAAVAAASPASPQ
eukprot:366268-Chlamydomonas_euryale.AAC.23